MTEKAHRAVTKLKHLLHGSLPKKKKKKKNYQSSCFGTMEWKVPLHGQGPRFDPQPSAVC